MKLVLSLSLLLLVAAMVQESEAGFFRRLRSRLREARDKVQKGVGHVTSVVKDARGIVKDGVRSAVSSGRRLAEVVRRLFRGKRSALTLNRVDDVNALDIATTLNLELPAVKEAFVLCDEDKSGSLDGLEVLTFLNKIEEMSTLKSIYQSTKQ